jgi:gamma-glutamyl:cysteine ligase YbdK (ATP-grasp superfamily)
MRMSGRLSLFEAFGIEIEYMIVDAATFDVRPICDRLFTAVAGGFVDEIERGPIAWSNELARHVVELKTNGPARALDGLHEAFAADVRAIDEVLARFRARLLGTGMHPWMLPHELELWPGGQNEVYESFDRIFGCKGHGWANLQSVHINLPFADDDELTRLHRAIRLLLPMLPALAASSPICEGRRAGWLDYRMEVYRHNADRVPSIAGNVVPEDITGEADYQRVILAPMYRDIAALDSLGVLQEEWLNSRGAIARFDRHAVEIRVVDCQECPRADLAIVEAVVAVLRTLVARMPSQALPTAAAPAQPGSSQPGASQHGTEALAQVFLATIRDAEAALLPADYVHALAGIDRALPAGELWARLLDGVTLSRAAGDALDVLLRQGPLARRILRAAPAEAGRGALERVYHGLADCLRGNALFQP